MFYRINWQAATRHVFIETGVNSAPAPISGSGMTDLGTFEHNNETERSTGLSGMQELADNHVIYHHVQDVLYKQGVQDMQSVKIYIITGAPVTPPGNVAPAITTQPTISGGTTVGDILTLARGGATGTPTPTATYQWLRNSAVLPGEDSLSLDTGGYGAGAYRGRVRWSNGVNPDGVATSNTITVQAAVTPPAPGIDYSRALVYFDANTPFTGTASDVTAITSRGSAGLSLAKTGAAAIRRTANGFVFADTGYVGALGVPAGAATDGMFLVVEFTQTAVGSNWARLSDGTGSRMRLQVHSGNQSIIGTGADDTNVNIALGTSTFGTRHIVAFEMDDVLNQLTGYDVSGASVGPIAHAGLTDPVNTRIDIGQFLNGTIHRWCLVGRTEGAAWPLTMAAVVADFQAGA